MAHPQPSVQDRILKAATEQSTLLKTLQETDYASGALSQNQNYINTLNKQISQKESRVKQLDVSRQKEQKEHSKYRDSTMKRLSYKLAGKRQDFEEKQKKEEQEYLSAVQEHFEESKCLESLKTQLREAKESQQELQAAQLKHKSAQEALERLYNNLFQGPTPAFPEEDQAENAVRPAQSAYQTAQQKLTAKTQVLNILGIALKVMTQVIRDMADAERASQMDIMGWGGSYADMAERSALARAQQNVQQVMMLMQQARGLSPEVGELGPMRIAQGHFMSDILFDNFFTDMSFHREIQESARQVVGAYHKLKAQVEQAERRVKDLRVEVDRQSHNLRAARERLMQVRARVFDSVAGGLPEYHP